MKEGYEQYLGTRKDPKTTRSARVPDNLGDEIELIAIAEGEGGISGLIIEGLIRVREDRRQMPNYEQWLAEAAQKRADKLHEEAQKVIGSAEHVTQQLED